MAHPDEDSFRLLELEWLVQFLPKGSSVLELGGGNGVQARGLADLGYEVSSVDLPARQRAAEHFEVLDYDGVHLPFPDRSFDVVFSSSTLEHVRQLPELLSEVRRVTKSDGIGVHIMPAVSWRAWNMLTYPVFFIRSYLRRMRTPPVEPNAPESAVDDAGLPTQRRSILTKVRSAVVSPPHGEFSSAFAELSEFSVRRWRRRFSDFGWEVVDVRSTPLFATGNWISGLSMHSRKRVAAVLGSAAKLYLVRPTKPDCGLREQ